MAAELCATHFNNFDQHHKGPPTNRLHRFANEWAEKHQLIEELSDQKCNAAQLNRKSCHCSLGADLRTWAHSNVSSGLCGLQERHDMKCQSGYLLCMIGESHLGQLSMLCSLNPQTSVPTSSNIRIQYSDKRSPFKHPPSWLKPFAYLFSACHKI